MTDQPQSFVNLFPWYDDTPVAGGLRSLMRVLDQLLLPALTSKQDYDKTVDELRNRLVMRFNEQVLPIIEGITADASLGAIFVAKSKTPVTVGLGYKTFVIDASNKTIFAASPYLAIVSQSDGRKSMTGVTSEYDRVTGRLIVNVLSCTEDDASASDWYICACPPPYVPQAIDAGRIEDTPDTEAVSFVFFREDMGDDGDGYV